MFVYKMLLCLLNGNSVDNMIFRVCSLRMMLKRSILTSTIERRSKVETASVRNMWYFSQAENWLLFFVLN